MESGSASRSGLWHVHRVAWALVGLVVAANAGAIVLAVLDRGVQSFVPTVMFTVATTGFALLGAVIVTWQSGNTVGWLFLALALFLALPHDLFQNYATYALVVRSGDLPGGTAAYWLASSALDTMFVLAMVLVLQLFPDGRPLTPRWRAVVGATVLGAALATLGSGTGTISASGPLADTANPLRVTGTAADLVSVLATVGGALLFGGFLAGMVSIALRFRRSHSAERQQVKWIVACALIVCLIQTANIVIDALTGHDYSAFNFVLAIIAFPIVVALAILRYRLYDIDLVMRRTLIYACLAAVLAALYLGGIAVISAASRFLTGQSGGLAVTLSTLAVAAAFQPLRRRIRHALDRRFDRRAYDGEATVQAFTGRAREQVDIDALCRELLSVVDTTMQPRHVSIWVRPTTPGS